MGKYLRNEKYFLFFLIFSYIFFNNKLIIVLYQKGIYERDERWDIYKKKPQD